MLKPSVLSLNALSAELGKDRRTLARLLAEVPPDGETKEGHPLWKVSTAVAALEAKKVKPKESPEEIAARLASSGGAPLSLDEAARLKENYLALLRQLEYDEKSGAVARIADIEVAVAAEYAVVRNRILSLPAEVAPRVAMMREPEEVEAFLAKEISQVLEGLTRDLEPG